MISWPNQLESQRAEYVQSSCKNLNNGEITKIAIVEGTDTTQMPLLLSRLLVWQHCKHVPSYSSHFKKPTEMMSIYYCIDLWEVMIDCFCWIIGLTLKSFKQKGRLLRFLLCGLSLFLCLTRKLLKYDSLWLITIRIFLIRGLSLPAIQT